MADDEIEKAAPLAQWLASVGGAHANGRVGGSVPKQHEPPALASLTGMPKGRTPEDAFRKGPTVSLRGITEGLGLDITKARAFEGYVKSIERAPNEVVLRQQVMEHLHKDMREADPTLRRVLLERSLSYYKSRRPPPTAKIPEGRAQGMRVGPAGNNFQKADPKGGAYHRRVTDPETGKHRYFYDPADYEKRPDAHVDGASAKKSHVKKKITEHVGDEKKHVDTLRPLAEVHGSDIVADAVRALIAEGVLQNTAGTLSKCAAPAEKKPMSKSDDEFRCDIDLLMKGSTRPVIPASDTPRPTGNGPGGAAFLEQNGVSADSAAIRAKKPTLPETPHAPVPERAGFGVPKLEKGDGDSMRPSDEQFDKTPDERAADLRESGGQPDEKPRTEPAADAGKKPQLVPGLEVRKAAAGPEGSRGGHVIGHTRSGKAVYNGSHEHKPSTGHGGLTFAEPAAGGFNAHDHHDAAAIHGQEAMKLGGGANGAQHRELAEAHRDAAVRLGATAKSLYPSSGNETPMNLTDWLKSEMTEGAVPQATAPKAPPENKDAMPEDKGTPPPAPPAAAPPIAKAVASGVDSDFGFGPGGDVEAGSRVGAITSQMEVGDVPNAVRKGKVACPKCGAQVMMKSGARSSMCKACGTDVGMYKGLLSKALIDAESPFLKSGSIGEGESFPEAKAKEDDVSASKFEGGGESANGGGSESMDPDNDGDADEAKGANNLNTSSPDAKKVMPSPLERVSQSQSIEVSRFGPDSAIKKSTEGEGSRGGHTAIGEWLQKGDEGDDAPDDEADDDDGEGGDDAEGEPGADMDKPDEVEKSWDEDYPGLVTPWPNMLAKSAGPFIGPHGGKWADPQHKVAWDEKKHAGKSAPTAKPHDEHTAEDLHLTAMNDSRLHGQHESIRANLANKMAGGTYDHAQATKLYGHMMKRAGDQYHKDVGVKPSPADRNAAAKKAADQFADEAKAGEHDHRLNGKNGKALAKHKLDNDKGTAYSLGQVGSKAAEAGATHPAEPVADSSPSSHPLGKAADAKSKTANASSIAAASPGDHEKAAAAHKEAEMAHAKAWEKTPGIGINSATAQHHYAQAAHHAKMAEMHSGSPDQKQAAVATGSAAYKTEKSMTSSNDPMALWLKSNIPGAEDSSGGHDPARDLPSGIPAKPGEDDGSQGERDLDGMGGRNNPQSGTGAGVEATAKAGIGDSGKNVDLSGRDRAQGVPVFPAGNPEVEESMGAEAPGTDGGDRIGSGAPSGWGTQEGPGGSGGGEEALRVNRSSTPASGGGAGGAQTWGTGAFPMNPGSNPLGTGTPGSDMTGGGVGASQSLGINREGSGGGGIGADAVRTPASGGGGGGLSKGMRVPESPADMSHAHALGILERARAAGPVDLKIDPRNGRLYNAARASQAKPAVERTTFIRKGMVLEDNGADIEAMRALQDDGFYQPGYAVPRDTGDGLAPIHKSMGCGSCGSSMPAYLTTCPSCGAGTMSKSSGPFARAPVGGVVVRGEPMRKSLPASTVVKLRD